MANQKKWNKIKAEYIQGNLSYRKLAEKHGVSFSTLRKRASVEKWTDLKNKKCEMVGTKIAESVATKEAKRVDVFNEIADMLLSRIASGIADGTLMANAKGMRDITGAIKDLRDIKGIKSDADAREQEARIAKLIKDASEEHIEQSINVVISGDLDDYTD